MKKIIFVRHAKSSWEFNVSDSERPLKKRGINDAVIIANALKEHNYKIDLMCSSPANRAFSTCKIFVEQLQFSQQEVVTVSKLYDFQGENVIEVINSLDNTTNTVMLFGHNHAFTHIANLFGDRHIENIPTAGLVVISFDITAWKYAKFGKTELILFPRDYKL